MTRIGSQMTTASFAVLDKHYRDSSLPESWRAMSNLAYSHAHMRAAAQSYQAQNVADGSDNLCKAVSLNPELAADGGRGLAAHFISWTDLPKIADPLAYLERIFDHLPNCVSTLRRQRRRYLGQAALQIAFQAYRRKDYVLARLAVGRAVFYQPHRLFNRGVVSILLRSNFTGSNTSNHQKESHGIHLSS
jgi:hypothetical protein